MLPSLERWAVYRLDRAAAALRESSQRALEPHDLPLTEVAALCVLADRVGLPQSALGERIGMDRTTASKLVSTLEESGLVERSPDWRDPRRHVVDITPSGQAALAAAQESLRRAEAEFFEPLYEHEVEQLRDILRQLEPPEYALGDLYYLAPRRRTPDDAA